MIWHRRSPKLEQAVLAWQSQQVQTRATPDTKLRACSQTLRQESSIGCLLRGSTHQLTQTDADTHSPTMDEAWRLLWKNRRKEYSHKGDRKTNRIN